MREENGTYIFATGSSQEAMEDRQLIQLAAGGLPGCYGYSEPDPHNFEEARERAVVEKLFRPHTAFTRDEFAIIKRGVQRSINSIATSTGMNRHTHGGIKLAEDALGLTAIVDHQRIIDILAREAKTGWRAKET